MYYCLSAFDLRSALSDEWGRLSNSPPHALPAAPHPSPKRCFAIPFSNASRYIPGKIRALRQRVCSPVCSPALARGVLPARPHGHRLLCASSPGARLGARLLSRLPCLLQGLQQRWQGQFGGELLGRKSRHPHGQLPPRSGPVESLLKLGIRLPDPAF